MNAQSISIILTYAVLLVELAFVIRLHRGNERLRRGLDKLQRMTR